MGVLPNGSPDPVDGIVFVGEYGESTPMKPSRAMAFVERFLCWLRPDTIVLGPVYSFGPMLSAADGRPKWGVLDRTGTPVGTSTDPIGLWRSWGDAVCGVDGY